MNSIPDIPEDADHLTLLEKRKGATPEEQKKLAPLEHRAYAREFTRDNPLLAVPSLMVAIPAYTLGKAAGLIKSRSPASLEEVTQGFRGIYEGLTIK